VDALIKLFNLIRKHYESLFPLVEACMKGKMNMTSLTQITKLMILGLMIFMTACSSLVGQPSSGVPSPTALPTTISEPTTIPTVQPTVVPTNPTAATSAPASTDGSDSAQYTTDDRLDGITYTPNTAFTKTWTLKNTGTCTWDSSYLVFYISGTTMTQQPGYWIVPRGQTVAPGQTVNISVGMTSPVENGSYQSYWGLKKENGSLLPIRGGANGNSFYVKIKVDNGTVVGNITAASIAIEREEGSGTVCTAEATYFVYASITADGPATANYEINSTAGQIAAGYFQTSPTGPVSPFVTGSLVFNQADTKTIVLRFAGPYPYPEDITVNLQVNGGQWHNTKLSCQ